MNSDLDGTIRKTMIRNARNEACMQENFFEHFKSKGHGGFFGNVSITLIDKTHSKNPKSSTVY